MNSMSGMTNIVLELAGLFAASALAAYTFHRLTSNKSRRLVLSDHSLLRITTGESTYRSRIIAETPNGWLIASPLQRDAYIPLHVDESLLIQAPQGGGIVRFRSIILARQLETHYLEIERPESWQKIERRNARRSSALEGAMIEVEGRAADLVDLSEHGAKALADGRFARGERVAVQMPWPQYPIAAWVLDVHPDPTGRPRSELRVCFEEPIDLDRATAAMASRSSRSA